LKLTPAARVGVVTLVSAIVLSLGMSWLTQFSFKPQGYRLKAVFGDVNGLVPGAGVYLMGVKVGRVVTLVPEDRRVVVELEIVNPKTRILEESRFRILSKGLVGEKTLEIFPPEDPIISTFLTADATVYGQDPARLENAIDQAQAALTSLRQLAESPETTEALRTGMKNFESAFAELRGLVKNTDKVAVETALLIQDARTVAGAIQGEDLAAMVKDLKAMSHGLRQTYQAVVDDGRLIEDTSAVIANIRLLTERVNHIAYQAETVVSDPKLQQDLKEIVSSSRAMLNSIGGPSFSPPKLSPRFDAALVQDSGRASAYLNGNFNFALRTGSDEFLLGVEEIGERNLWNLSWGKPGFFTPQIGFHLGMVRSKIGAGLDWEASPKVILQGEVFNPLDPNFRLGGMWYPDWLGDKYGLTGQWIRGLNTGEDSLRLGLQWRPID
jgi:phospholipid/cholesterol/gamma-HCH transport system substrate-binding protein